MSGPVTGVEIGRQFWVSDTIETLKKAIGARTTSTSSTTQTEQKELHPPDKSFVNFVNGGKGGQFAPAFDAARIKCFQELQVGTGRVANDEATAQATLDELVGSTTLDQYVDDLAGRVLHNENCPHFNERDEAQTKELLKKSLVAFLNMSEAKNLATTHRQGGCPSSWNDTNEIDNRSLAIDNAVLGIAELIDSGAVDESSVFYLQDTKVLSVSNYEDLSEIMTATATAAKDTFIDEKRLGDLKNAAKACGEQIIAKLSSPKKLLNVKADTKPYQKQIDAIKSTMADIGRAVDELVEARRAVTTNLKLTVDSGADLKSELQKISNSTRTFRYSMDQHVKRSGEGFGTKVRRFFSNIFFRDSKTSVSNAAFKKIQTAEKKLRGLLESLRIPPGLSSAPLPKLDFAGIATTSKSSGDLTHIANSLLRNCSKKVDKSYVAYINRAHEIFDGALNADSSSGTGVKTLKMTCKLGAELAFEFGIGSGKAGVDVQREIEVLLHPGGAVSMRLATGAGVHGDVAIGPGSAKAKAAYMQGRVLTYDNFDKFVAAAYGKLALPVTKDEKNERVDGTIALKGKDVKFLGDTSGNAAKRLFKSMGFLEFGTRVDTEFFLHTLNSKNFMLTTTALIDGLDSNQGHVASAKERRVSGGVSVGITYASDDETKNFDFGVGVEGVLWKRTNDVETVNIFDLMAQMTPKEIKETFEKQMESVRKNVLNPDKADNPKSFLSRTGFGQNFHDEINEIVSKAQDGSLTLATASKQIRDQICSLRWEASAQSPGKKDEEYWKDYARCLRACTLAQSVIETLLPDTSNAQANEIYARSEEIQRLAKGLREEMPDKVFDNNVMYGVKTREEPWHAAARLNLSFALDITGDETVDSSRSGPTNRTGRTGQSGQDQKKVDLDFDGTVTWFETKKGEVPDKYRPWATAPGRYVDINLKNGEMKDKLLDEIVEKALPNDESARPALKTQLTDLLVNAGVKVEGASGSTGTTRTKGTVSIRLEYDRNDGEKDLVRFSASSQKVTTQSKSVGKGPLKVNLSREMEDTSELTSLFLKPSLARIMGDVETLSKGSLSELPAPALTLYANKNHEVVEKFCDDLTRADSESGKMLSEMKRLIPKMKTHPAYKGWATAFENRLNRFDEEFQRDYSSNSGNAAWKVEKGTEFLLLATQTMRLMSMFENDPMKDENVFVV